jgi:hypothetical protein
LNPARFACNCLGSLPAILSPTPQRDIRKHLPMARDASATGVVSLEGKVISNQLPRAKSSTTCDFGHREEEPEVFGCHPWVKEKIEVQIQYSTIAPKVNFTHVYAKEQRR